MQAKQDRVQVAKLVELHSFSSVWHQSVFFECISGRNAYDVANGALCEILTRVFGEKCHVRRDQHIVERLKKLKNV